MRLFAAIPMPAVARSALLEVLGALRRLEWPVRWVQDTNLHLTLKFYGEVDDAQVHTLETGLIDATHGTPPLAFHLSGLGAFPTLRSPRVIWVSIDAPPALELLQHRIEQAAAECGFALDGKPFRPHVTLGRVRKHGKLPATAPAQLEAMGMDLAFEARQLVLFESRLSRAGAEHSARRTVDLTGVPVP